VIQAFDANSLKEQQTFQDIVLKAVIARRNLIVNKIIVRHHTVLNIPHQHVSWMSVMKRALQSSLILVPMKLIVNARTDP
jgi:hypothetical protein